MALHTKILTLPGGDFGGSPLSVRATLRNATPPYYRYNGYGFRIAASPAHTQTTTSITPIPDPTSPSRESGNELTITLRGGVEMVLLRVPAGEFLMGRTESDRDASDYEKPQRKVFLDEYWIGKYEVTNAQFAAFVKATNFHTAAEKGEDAYVWTGLKWVKVNDANWRYPKGKGSTITGKGNHPVGFIDWDDAVAFCAWVTQISGKQVQLPTEAQWEKAARGSDGRMYPWGNEDADASRLNLSDLDTGNTTEVGKYSPAGDSPYGAADMAGNVLEWVADWFDGNYYAIGPTKNPKGPPSGEWRVVRGGWWGEDFRQVRAPFRSYFGASAHYLFHGFRVAMVFAPDP